ncbi:MAG: methylenetetrahydrofolate--tRNA-(uracil(54)-C(5))-methyltransferase (FADH(2)-oxidizing) TrmFO [Myxococcota bacterium]
MTTLPPVTIVGGGLAGCEAAYQLAQRGHLVRLHEMKPERRTPAQTGDGLAELVCSNSMRGASLTNAVGLLKEELHRAGSLVMRVAHRCRVPAGGALAVDREAFSAEMTARIASHPRIELIAGEVRGIPTERPCILATGPLTADALAADIARHVGAEHLAYYDAIAPIVAADSIDWDVVWRQSRYDKGTADYVNCPLDEPTYQAFLEAILAAEKVPAKDFEDAKYFEGCLPLEVMAERGPQTLLYGPMKPVGLTDPRTGRRPHAVVQLRAEDHAGTAFNMVGFQSRMKWPAQKQVFRQIPGLERATFMRFGAVHRNTFLQAPVLLDEMMQLRALPGVYVAGQLAGVEGYVESTAGGLLCGILLARRLAGEPAPLPPPTTALGGLLHHLRRPPVDKAGYQPSNITWAHVPPLPAAPPPAPGRRRPKKMKKHERYALLADRALDDLTPWLTAVGVDTPLPSPWFVAKDEPAPSPPLAPRDHATPSTGGALGATAAPEFGP